MPQPLSFDDLSALLASWVTAVDAPISITDAGADRVFVYVNPAFESAFGYPAAELLGRHHSVLHSGGDTDASTVDDVDVARTGRPVLERVQKRRADGNTWWSQLHLSPVRDPTGRVTHVLAYQVDITDQVSAEQETAHAALHDGLTGLPSRAHFLGELDRELARAARDRTGVAVLFLDVDHLKATNDTHGHAAGDALLVEVAHRLRRRLRGGDLAARYGGDEFLVLLVGLPHDAAEATARATGVLADLVHSLGEPADIGGVSLSLAVSVGLSLYPFDETTAAGLVAHADAGMYRHKRHP